ncbi:ATP-binding cassette domain-containing protein [Mycobacterium sp.]|uniref:ABC transporter ATP-binding protein n=1 Tax=Mycobacterium sp. TaxID=1785 RepID=UPI003D6A7634
MGDLRIKDLVVEYSNGAESIQAIDNLNLEITAGSLVIVLGPSGCGKTTLLSCLGGILSPTSGRIQFGDVEVTALDRRELTAYRRHTVGIIFQTFNLVPSLSAVENVMVPMWAAGWSRRTARERAHQLLARLGLQNRMTHRPGDLSGGQQQRVAVARALALNPTLILADEPTAHLDFVQVEEVLRLLRELATGERIVVVATHDARILPLADRVIELVPPFTSADREPETVRLTGGSVLFEQGGIADLIYIVSEGELAIVRESPGGRAQLLKVATPGDYVGEIEPLLHLPRSATAYARTDATVTGYTARAFRRLLDTSSERYPVEHHKIDIEQRTTGHGHHELGDALLLTEQR